MEQVLKTALGVFIGGLAAIFAWEGIHLAAVKYAADEAVREMQIAAKQAEKQAKAQAANQAAQAAARAKAMTDAENAARQRQAEAQHEEMAFKAVQAALKNAKEDAWKRFYQPTDACKQNWTGDCANAYIVAKKEFEQSYRPGQ